jgi:putative transposase
VVQTFYVLFFVELRRRRLLLVNVTKHPHAEWVLQPLRNLSVQHDHLPRFIVHDRASKFSEAFDAFTEASGTKIIKLPARSPNLNAYAERWVRSVREECLDQIIVLSERHLRYVLKEYVEYFMKRRPHQGLKQQTIEKRRKRARPRQLSNRVTGATKFGRIFHPGCVSDCSVLTIRLSRSWQDPGPNLRTMDRFWAATPYGNRQGK